MEKSSKIVGLQTGQGWTDETLLILALRYISACGETEEFEEYLAEIAQEELAS